jgi:HlyD family secretion protein
VRTRRQAGALIGPLRTLYNVGAIGDMTDGQLLERFATDNDEAAELTLSALVERHELMVWRACLAILGNEHEAEDAFQSTFLVLVRKARTLWVRDSIGPWLHQVACRTASCLRKTRMRRQKRERPRSGEDLQPSAFARTSRDFDVEAAIHEEVNSLPEKYRSPLVLCDFQGRSHREAARFLGWPIGTVKSRQSQGRGLVRARLVKRGIGLSVAGFAVESFCQSAIAAVPKHLSRRAIDAAMHQTARLYTGSAITAHALSLTREAIQTMTWFRYRVLAVATVAIGIASAGASLSFFPQEKTSSDGPHPPTLPPPSTTPADGNQPATPTKPVGPPEPGSPQARLLAQRLATRKAKALFEIAKLTRELADISFQEYDEVTYPRELVIVDGDVKLAESDLKRAEDRLDWARRMFDKGYVSPATKTSEEVTLKKAKFSIEQAASKKKVLTDYTRDKTRKELRSEVEKARSDELAKQAAWESQKAKELELERLLGPGAR